MSRTSETEPHAGLPLHGAETSAPSRLSEPKMTRAQVLELLQAEVDRHRPLADKRRAAAILAETSIRFTDEPETEGFIIAGPNGQPRTIVRDGQTVPFTLQDLAAEVRSKYPALFYSAEAGDHGPVVEPPQPETSPPPPRDWLMVGSGEHEPPQPDEGPQEDAPRPLPDGSPVTTQAVSPETQPIETSERPQDGPSGILAEPAPSNNEPHRQSGLTSRGENPTSAIPVPRDAAMGPRFRPSYALYGAAAVAACALVVLIFSRPGPDAPHQDLAMQQARSGAQPGQTATAPAAPGPPVPPPERPRDAIAGSAEAVDTSTLRVDGKIVRLFGVEWARGGDAEDLTRYLAGREVVCMPTVRSDRHRCQVEGRDLSEVVLFNGGGRATPDATPELKAAEAKARAAGHGVWQKP
jgi:endonuclease YncB( thermonuclease family)